MMGLDDVRPFNFRQRERIPIYAAPATMAAIRRSFPYIFDDGKKESNVPQLEAREFGAAPIELFGVEFLPVPILHGSQTIHGFRFGEAAYLTDHSDIPDAFDGATARVWTCCSWTRCGTSRTPRTPPWTGR